MPVAIITRHDNDGYNEKEAFAQVKFLSTVFGARTNVRAATRMITMANMMMITMVIMTMITARKVTITHTVTPTNKQQVCPEKGHSYCHDMDRRRDRKSTRLNSSHT